MYWVLLLYHGVTVLPPRWRSTVVSCFPTRLEWLYCHNEWLRCSRALSSISSRKVFFSRELCSPAVFPELICFESVCFILRHRHSNLSGVHVVFHVVCDDSVSGTGVTSRHPVILGLRNVLKVCISDTKEVGLYWAVVRSVQIQSECFQSTSLR